MKRSEDDVKLAYQTLVNLERCLTDIVADNPPPRDTASDQLVVDCDLLEDLDLVLDSIQHQLGRFPVVTDAQLSRLREVEAELKTFIAHPPTREEWRRFVDDVKVLLEEEKWRGNMSEDEYLLVYYWSEP
jgi:hypothetical protein